MTRNEARELWRKRLADITESNRRFDQEVERKERLRAAKLAKNVKP